ncbi:hypothetical protein BC943DRAFT_285185 [Umbelopsis sp. AD052]|nr:hypothetical protein BC943DRAFT_285185 [Umbelopsis sp. AD052]
MLVLRHNSLAAEDLFVVERKLLHFVNSHEECPLSLDFDVFTRSRPELYGIVLGMFARLDLHTAAGVSLSELLDFIIDVDKGYFPNPYHNFFHAVDVTGVLFFILNDVRANRYLSKIDAMALLLAALCHDIGHPGYNNSFQVNMKSDIATRYNNQSVLESHSCTLTLNLLSKHKLLQRLGQAHQANMSEEAMKTFITEMILATDMAFHYNQQDKLSNLIETVAQQENWTQVSDAASIPSPPSPHEAGSPPIQIKTRLHVPDGVLPHDIILHSKDDYHPSFKGPKSEQEADFILNQQDRQSLCRLLLHGADISNTVRPWSVCKKWSDLVVEEFFRQGDAERLHGLQISPGMDREESTQAEISLQFGDLVVGPYFELFAELLPNAQSFVEALTSNRGQWESLSQQPEPTPSALTCNETPRRDRLSVSSYGSGKTHPPGGRRVSVAAGTLFIPDDSDVRLTNDSNGGRSASHSAIAEHDKTLRAKRMDTLERRRSEEPSAHLQRFQRSEHRGDGTSLDENERR